MLSKYIILLYLLSICEIYYSSLTEHCEEEVNYIITLHLLSEEDETIT